MSEEPKICVRCNRPVTANRDMYEVLERMHWICFHLEFEHQGDPDKPCEDPSCPWWKIEIFRNKLSALGVNPDEVVGEAIRERYIH